MIVDVHTHCLQPDHVSEKSRAADERAGYPPMQPLTPEAYLAGMDARRSSDRLWDSGPQPRGGHAERFYR